MFAAVVRSQIPRAFAATRLILTPSVMAQQLTPSNSVLVGIDACNHIASLKTVQFAAKHFPTKRLDLVLCFSGGTEDVVTQEQINKGIILDQDNGRQWKEKSQTQLEELENLMRADHPSILTTTTVLLGDPRTRLMEQAAELRSDCLVVGAHGKSAPHEKLGEVAQHLAAFLVDRALVIVR